jgi:large subunit ribosomal protein L17
MRHRRKVNKLGRKAEHRKAMLANLAVSLIMHKRIKTTVPKAKALRQFIEPLITRAKEDTTHNRRIAFRYLRNKYAVSELFREVAKKVENRPGGYTRILKLGFRKGDGAEMDLIELVDYNPDYTQNPAALAGEKKRRTRRGGKKKTSTEQVAQAQETVTEETEQLEQQTQESDQNVETPEQAQTESQEQAKEDSAEQDKTENTEEDKQEGEAKNE